MGMLSKIEKAAIFSLRSLTWPFSARKCTQLMTWWYRRHGMKINGELNYLAAHVRIDGTDYSWVELNEGCTISDAVSILTHDWSPYTIGRGLGLDLPKPIGIFRPVRVGRYCFIGTRSVLMPGADVGDGSVIGAASVVRGKVPPWTIMVGNPAQPVGDSREFLLRNLRKMGREDLAQQVEKILADSRAAAGSQASAPAPGAA